MADEIQASELEPVAMPLLPVATAPIVEAAPSIATPMAAPEPKSAKPAEILPAIKPAARAVPLSAPAKPTLPVAKQVAEPPLVKRPLAKAKPVVSKPAPAGKPPKAAPVPPKTAVAARAAPLRTPAKSVPVATATVPEIKPAKPVFAQPILTKLVAAKIAAPKPHSFQEIFTMNTPTFDFAAAFKTAFSDAQEKAKVAYDKSTVALGDANEFAKGNVEALVESSKILATGLQELTTELVAESREAFESLTAEVKTIATVKSPADFFKLQSELLRKQVDVLIANGTKHSEAFIKLANDAAAPLSSRVSLAVEKVKATV